MVSNDNAVRFDLGVKTFSTLTVYENPDLDFLMRVSWNLFE